MNNAIIFVCILIVIMQIWWAAAYYYAYRHIKSPLLLVQVIQGASYALCFSFITISLLNPQSISGMFMGILLVIGVVMGMLWRRRDGVYLLMDYYPRAMADVLLFRKPLPEPQKSSRDR